MRLCRYSVLCWFVNVRFTFSDPRSGSPLGQQPTVVATSIRDKIKITETFSVCRRRIIGGACRDPSIIRRCTFNFPEGPRSRLKETTPRDLSWGFIKATRNFNSDYSKTPWYYIYVTGHESVINSRLEYIITISMNGVAKLCSRIWYTQNLLLSTSIMAFTS